MRDAGYTAGKRIYQAPSMTQPHGGEAKIARRLTSSLGLAPPRPLLAPFASRPIFGLCRRNKPRAAGALPDQPSRMLAIWDEPDLCTSSRDTDKGILSLPQYCHCHQTAQATPQAAQAPPQAARGSAQTHPQPPGMLYPSSLDVEALEAWAGKKEAASGCRPLLEVSREITLICNFVYFLYFVGSRIEIRAC